MLRTLIITFIIGTMLLVACSNKNEAPNAVENYLQALVAKDSSRLLSLSCASWEEGAIAQLDSFQAVAIDLKDLSCSQTGSEGETALVLCQGSIMATYGAEVQDFPLNRQEFKVVKEGGDWRVCGYK